MLHDPSKARYYLRSGLTALDKLGPPLRDHLAAIYGQWLAEAGWHMPEELREEWASVSKRMLAHAPSGAYSGFEVSVATMSDVEAQQLVDDVASIMVKLGHDNDPDAPGNRQTP